MKVTSTEKMNEAFREKDDKYQEWATRETREKKVSKAVMVPIIISHDGAVHRESVRRWKNFAPDIQVDWVRMAQNVMRYNVVIVGRFFNRGCCISDAWRREHPDDFEEKRESLPERIPTAQEREELLNLEPSPEGVVCVRSSDTPLHTALG